jgi:N-acetylglucosamine kinase-like BadF-type ATPase
MILIADSGSTKTDWVLSANPQQVIHTQGINPFHQSAAEMAAILSGELLPQLPVGDVGSVCFYGSGVRPELEPLMANLLKEAFPQAERVEAHGDLLGAARALCGRNEGIASILGTGANSCLYDGEAILQNTPPLGYILGDEGSGAVLGKLLVNALYKGRLSNEIVADFQRQTGLDMPAVIARVYRQPMANRFLASLCPFIHDHLGDPCLKSLVIDAFRDFFRINIAPYRRRDLPVAFVGSVAWFFSEQLTEAAAAEGFCVGTVCRSPLLGLLRYHAV